MLQFSVLYAARLCVWNKTRATCFFIIVRWKQKGNRPSAIVRNVMRAQHLEISLFQFRERAGTQLRNVNRQPVRYTELLKCCTSTFKRPVLELLIFLCMLFTLCFINQTIHNFFFFILCVCSGSRFVTYWILYLFLYDIQFPHLPHQVGLMEWTQMELKSYFAFACLLKLMFSISYPNNNNNAIISDGVLFVNCFWISFVISL